MTLEPHSQPRLSESMLFRAAEQARAPQVEPSAVDPRLAAAFRLVCLRDTVRYARSECPLYADYPDVDIKRFQDLEQLPVIDRMQLESVLAGTCARSHPADTYYATSGTSSGQSLYVPRSRAERAAVDAYRSSARETAEVASSSSGKTLRLVPGGRLIAGGAGVPREIVFVYHNNMARENLWDNWDTVISQLFAKYPTGRGFGPIDAVHATPPFALSLLTRLMQQRGIDPASTEVRRLFVTGAHMSTFVRQRLRDAWNATLVTTYSCAELNHSASECRLRPKHYHFDAVTHVEVVDPRTQEHVQEGESGRVLLTGLYPFHRASIFLRYAVGDWARWCGDRRCECGVIAPTIELLGRESHCPVVETADGTPMRLSSAHTLEALARFDAIPAIPRPQFRWALPAAGERKLTLHVECYALGSASWQRQQKHAICDALRAEHEQLATALGAGTLELEVVLYPRSALSVALPAR